MKQLRSIEIHDKPDGKAIVIAVYTTVGETVYTNQVNGLIREPFPDLPAPVDYWQAVKFAELKGKQLDRAVIDYILMNASVPLAESMALMKRV